VLGNRVFLIITGYPQLGNGTLHISHAIWGALMMAVAIVFALSFLAPNNRTFIAFIGGCGFGWFIDELGKFITRDVNSEKARELATLGAAVVAADVDDPASLDLAFAGAYGAYCVTFYWAHFSPEKEMAEVAAMAQAYNIPIANGGGWPPHHRHLIAAVAHGWRGRFQVPEWGN